MLRSLFTLNENDSTEEQFKYFLLIYTSQSAVVRIVRVEYMKISVNLALRICFLMFTIRYLSVYIYKGLAFYFIFQWYNSMLSYL